MTEQATNKPLREIPLAPGALKACAECPWRASNIHTLDTKRDDDTFSRDNMTQHWKNLVEQGSTCSCHLTTPGYYYHDEKLETAGFKKPQRFKGEGHRQCAGQLAVVRKELYKLAKYESHASYLEANPTGLTAPVAAHFLRILKDPQSAPVDFRWPAENVDDVMDPADLVDTESLAWTFNRHGAADMRNVMEVLMPSLGACNCAFCSRHEELCPAAPVNLADGTVINVDKRLTRVMTAFAAAGVNTSQSCQNFKTALSSVDLGGFLELRDMPAGHINYSTPLKQGGAYVRFGTHQPLGKQVADALRNLPGVTLEEHGIVAQISFSIISTDDISEAIIAVAKRSLATATKQKKQ